MRRGPAGHEEERNQGKLIETHSRDPEKDPGFFMPGKQLQIISKKVENYFAKLQSVTLNVTGRCYTDISKAEAASTLIRTARKYLKTANHPKGWDAKLRGLKQTQWQPGRQYFDP